MKTKAISEVCFVNPRMPASLASQKGRDVDFVPMANVGEDGRIKVNGQRKLQEVQKGYTYFQNGDVIVAKITPCMENGKAAYVRDLPNEVGFGSTEFHVLRPHDGLDPAYLFHMIWSPFFRREAARNMTGTAGQQRVPTSFFERFNIPLPPLHDQRRIADILDKADAIRRKRQEAIGQTYDLRRVLLLEFTGDASSAHVRSELHNTSTYLPKGFQWRRLDEVCDAICDIDHNMPKAVEKGVPFISPKDMPDNEELCFDDVKYISKDDFDRLSRKIRPRRNDIIYSRIGARLGKARLVRVDFDFLPSYSCCTIRVKENEVHPEYVTYYLDSIITRRQANLDTQSIAVPDLGLAKIKAFLVPVPSMEKQLQFVAQINVINSQISKMKSAVSDANNLFNSLVQRAFRGEL